jgi:type IV pilus assembly protein PilE
VPAYKDYIRRGQVPESFTGLADFRIKMEQYYQDNRRYGTTVCTDGANAPSWNSFVSTGSSYFTFSCALTDAGQGFKLTATGTAGQASGHAFTLDHNNSKGTTQFKNNATSKACWMIKGDEC